MFMLVPKLQHHALHQLINLKKENSKKWCTTTICSSVVLCEIATHFSVQNFKTLIYVTSRPVLLSYRSSLKDSARQREKNYKA